MTAAAVPGEVTFRKVRHHERSLVLPRNRPTHFKKELSRSTCNLWSHCLWRMRSREDLETRRRARDDLRELPVRKELDVGSLKVDKMTKDMGVGNVGLACPQSNNRLPNIW